MAVSEPLNRVDTRKTPRKAKSDKPTMTEKINKQVNKTRHVTRICTLNVYSIANKLAAVQQFLEDNRIHIAIITETHIQENGYADIAIAGYTIAGTCCREVGKSKGGVAIFVHTTVPSSKKYDKIVTRPNELEYCAATVYPNHNPRDKLEIVGVYRPPETDHPSYEEASNQMLRSNREENITTIIIGDLNIHSWDTNEKNGYQRWVENEQLWELSDPQTPTYRTGTVTDGVLLAPGEYLPDGILPQDADPEEDGGVPHVYPVWVTETTVLVDHHALFLDIVTIAQHEQPRVEKYSLYTMTEEAWRRKNEALKNDPRVRRLQDKISTNRNIQRNYQDLIQIIKKYIKDKKVLSTNRRSQNTTAAFEKRYKAHELFPGYQLAREQKEDRIWIKIQNKILRAEWREFLATVRMGDLRRIFQYFARKDGRTEPSYRPSCLDPLCVDGRIIVRAQEKAEALACHFATKLSTGGPITKQSENLVRRKIREGFRVGRWQLLPPITEQEIMLAAREMSKGKAAGPDGVPAEVYQHLSGLHGPLAELYTQMIEDNNIPEEACRYYIVPFDKVGKDPSQCSAKRPISLLNTSMKLLESIVVRRLQTVLEPKITGNQYAYQRKRSAEILLADLDSFVGDSLRESRAIYMAGLDIQGAFDNADLLCLIEALKKRGVPPIMARFIGNWMTARSFRIRLTMPTGQYFSRPYIQNRGIPRGGVLSPLMWILLINEVPVQVQRRIAEQEPDFDVEERLLLQIFADDVSAALSADDEMEAVRLSHILVMAICDGLRRLGLTLSPIRCKNFLMRAMEGVHRLFKRGTCTTRWMREKEKLHVNALNRQITKGQEQETDQPEILPFQIVESFKLLGIHLDRKWTFQDHTKEVQRKLRTRQAIIGRVGNTGWGLENRVLTTTAHALVESVLNYGLTITGSAMHETTFRSMDTAVLNPVARRVAGVGYSIRREVLYTLADLHSTQNHYLLKTANLFDRTLRARGTRAQTNLQKYLRKEKIQGGLWKSGVEMKNITEQITSPKGLVRGKIELQEHEQNKKANPLSIPMNWRIHQLEEKEGKEPLPVARNSYTSIYGAQAEEIVETPGLEHLVFQYEGIKDWRGVASRVLANIGWEPGCVYEDTLFPKTEEETTIQWKKIQIIDPKEENEQNEQTQRGAAQKTGEDALEIQIINWEYKQIALAAVLQIDGGRPLKCDILLLGGTLGRTSETAAGLALAEGLKRAAKDQLTEQNKCVKQ